MDAVLQIRVDGKRKSAYESAAKSRGLKLSAWLRDVADLASGLSKEPVKGESVVKPGVPVEVEPVKGVKVVGKVRPFDPKGEIVLAEPVEAKGLDYTGEKVFKFGRMLYEYRSGGALLWTLTPPSGK